MQDPEREHGEGDGIGPHHMLDVFEYGCFHSPHTYITKVHEQYALTYEAQFCPYASFGIGSQIHARGRYHHDVVVDKQLPEHLVPSERQSKVPAYDVNYWNDEANNAGYHMDVEADQPKVVFHGLLFFWQNAVVHIKPIVEQAIVDQQGRKEQDGDPYCCFKNAFDVFECRFHDTKVAQDLSTKNQ